MKLKCMLTLEDSHLTSLFDSCLMSSEFQPKKGILGRSAGGRRVNIMDSKHDEFVIASDNEGKNLRHVRK